jgi:hypothetical protein
MCISLFRVPIRLCCLLGLIGMSILLTGCSNVFAGSPQGTYAGTVSDSNTFIASCGTLSPASVSAPGRFVGQVNGSSAWISVVGNQQQGTEFVSTHIDLSCSARHAGPSMEHR